MSSRAGQQPLLIFTFVLSLCIINSHAAFGDKEVLQKISSRPSKCGPLCQTHGTCNEELGRCDCPIHKEGPNCEKILTDEELESRCSSLGYGVRYSMNVAACARGPSHCINQCNDRGSCERGFCSCMPGHYGIDCSLSLDDQGRPQILQGTGYVTRSKRPWIYMYDLPPEFTIWIYFMRQVDRPTFFFFLQRLLGSGALTADPQKADFFFIPHYMRHPEDIAVKLVKVMAYINTTWPYYQHGRKGSHVVLHTGDWGKMEAAPWFKKLDGLRNNLTWLTHWGIYNNSNKNHWAVAHTPGQDVVIPVITPMNRLPVFGHEKSPLHPGAQKLNVPPKDKIFFHAGRICGEFRPPNTSRPWPDNCMDAKRYSGGIRQRVHSFHHNRTGYLISNHIPQYASHLRTSKWCLSTQGGGHGNRQVIGTLAGCNPVSIGDGIYEPFEPEMDYNKFGIKLREADIPEMHKIIESVGEEEYARKQVALRCAAQHLHYASMVGGMMQESGRYDAFETTLEVLRVRVDHPGTPPHEYAQLDKEFKKFMACGAEEFGEQPLPEPHNVTLCSISAIDTKNKCSPCLRLYGNTLGPPGGAACCGHLNLATCPRNWD